MASASPEESCWIYHERQQAALCGQHTLNNLLQSFVFTAESLRDVAQALDQQELAFYVRGSPEYHARLREGSNNVDPYGNFSIQVLQQALSQLPMPVELRNVNEENIRHIEMSIFEGFICHKDAHWFAIRKINGRFWNLNSFLAKPEIVSTFKIATEVQGLQKLGYTVFVAVPIGWKAIKNGIDIDLKLPDVCRSEEDRSRGKMKYWWNEKLLLKSAREGAINTSSKANWSYENTNETEVKDSANATQDPWLNVGGGQALGSNAKKTTTEDGGLNYVPQNEFASLKVLPEPTNSDTKTRLQIKLPQNKRAVRFFEKSDTVAYLYKAVFDIVSTGPEGKHLQLSAGFPPQVLTEGKLNLEEAGLVGASINVRWI